MKKKYILHSPHIEQLKKKKRKVFRNRIIFFGICFLIIFTGLIFLSRWQKLNIENIQISGNKVIETNDIENLVRSDLAGKYLWVFPKTNFVLYPKSKINRDLENTFKRFSDISINLDTFKTLNIAVIERDGKYLWCGIDPSLISQCYFMDQVGYIFDESPYFSGDVYFKFYGKNGENSLNPTGAYFLKDQFESLVTFKNDIAEMNLKPTAFWIDQNGAGNISLGGDPALAPKIIFKLDADYGKLAENLQATITTEPLATKLKTNFPSLLYLDLRFGNNVYYKFKQ